MDGVSITEGHQPMQTVQPMETARSVPTSGGRFSFAALVRYLAAPLLASALMIVLAFWIPWHGGLVPGALMFIFWLTIVVNAYSLVHGYRILRTGLEGGGLLLWRIMVAISCLFVIDTIVSDSIFTGRAIIFPGSDFLVSPNMLLFLLAFQMLYFFITTLSRAMTAKRGAVTADWYISAYAFIVAINTAAIIIGPPVISLF